ncbi:MOSC domain-containing protein [Deinococcus arenicola]|uniref:MOSC N-terminal beta barrel domain-containing protein n=1 Tax=Deinococcus arenicola TaxID=2994950 RepID=A0ABU4DSP7_9DEIO|nr:MOSC N-terminal beta barrel domain-containing protein [Deinococcus sp. ZS9-10]MDV6375456.1 MOSC N-terminal beta barrel domain-containing protein [Deinococcus sp. ZS9-10]
MTTLTAAAPRISALYIYPIKSAGGVSLQHSEIGPRGLMHDRRWMVIDAAGKPVTQREFATMRLMDVALIPDGLHVTAPGMPALAVPWQPQGHSRAVDMWGDPLAALTVSAQATAWVSTYLGSDLDLVYLPDEAERWQPDYKPFGSLLSFVDGNPFHLISEASLADFNKHLSRPVGHAEFRPNLVISGGSAYAEDFWRRIRIGPVEGEGVDYEVVESCARCVILNTLPDGTRGSEVLKTLARVRRHGQSAIFGQHLVQDAPYDARTGKIHVGDVVQVVEMAATVNPVYY